MLTAAPMPATKVTEPEVVAAAHLQFENGLWLSMQRHNVSVAALADRLKQPADYVNRLLDGNVDSISEYALALAALGLGFRLEFTLSPWRPDGTSTHDAGQPAANHA